MRMLLLLLSLFQIAQGSCPTGFDLVQGECRGFYTRVDILWVGAVTTVTEKCAGILGQPIIIHNEEDNKYWATKTQTATNSVIGLVCDYQSKKLLWADRSPVYYKPTNYLKQLDEEECTPEFTWAMIKDGGWSGSTAGGDYPIDIYCASPENQPIRTEDGCDYFENDTEDKMCYQVGATAENWQDAQMICLNLGANLASIHNGQENSFVRRLAVSNGAVNGLFLGARNTGKSFEWIDGTPWDYANFYPGFPIPGIVDCLAMDTSMSTGQWMNNDCSAKLPVACSRDRMARTYIEPTCIDGLSMEGTILTSPGFPHNATIPCEFFLQVDEGKRVELEIIFMEANPCCDFLVVHEGFLGGNVIANWLEFGLSHFSLTGEQRDVRYMAASNLMRVSWQPARGLNVRGVAMIFHRV